MKTTTGTRTQDQQGQQNQQDDLVAAAMAAVQQPPQARPQQQAAPQNSAPPSDSASSENNGPPIAPSHTLETLEPRRRPQPATVCEGCPNSVWFTSPSEVKCYCRVMYLITWGTREPNQITACDGMYIGQEDAVHM